MALSLNEARESQATYRPNGETTAKMQGINTLLFVGPAGIGKSTTLDMVARIDNRFRRTGSIGSRPLAARDDPALFRHYSKDELLVKIAAGQVVNYAIHPTTDAIYATTADMYAAPFNMLEMLPAGIDQFRGLGLGSLQIFYIVTDASDWQRWFESRYPAHTQERQKRLNEAMVSLEWSLDQPTHSFTWIKNTANHQQDTAQQIISVATSSVVTGNYRDLAIDMLAVAKKL